MANDIFYLGWIDTSIFGLYKTLKCVGSLSPWLNWEDKYTFYCWKYVIMVLSSWFSITKGYDQYNVDRKIDKTGLWENYLLDK